MHFHKRVLVTGGAGFIGSHLCERLLEQGCEVLCVDNFFTGTRANAAHLIGNPMFELQRHDVTFPLFVEVDEIYNLACPASLAIRQLAEGAIELTGSKSRLETLPLPQDDPRQRQPDIGLAAKTLDWAPHIALVDGLKRTIAYFEEQMRERGRIEALTQ